MPALEERAQRLREDCLVLIGYLRDHPDLEPEQRRETWDALWALFEEESDLSWRLALRRLEGKREEWKHVRS